MLFQLIGCIIIVINTLGINSAFSHYCDNRKNEGHIVKHISGRFDQSIKRIMDLTINMSHRSIQINYNEDISKQVN